MLIIRGTVVHTPVRGHVEVLPDRILVIDDGKIASMIAGEEEANCLALYGRQAEDVLRLSADQFLLPGFIDTHIHAPQYAFAGTATDTPLMDWLKQVSSAVALSSEHALQKCKQCMPFRAAALQA
jgi:guanine deaminase